MWGTASMWYLFWISAQTPSVPGRLRLTRRWMPAGVSSYITSAAWLVMSMNGGWYLHRSSIRRSSPLTSPPRRGGMISKLISGWSALARCSVTFIIAWNSAVRRGAAYPQAGRGSRRGVRGPRTFPPSRPSSPRPSSPILPPDLTGEEGEKRRALFEPPLSRRGGGEAGREGVGGVRARPEGADIPQPGVSTPGGGRGGGLVPGLGERGVTRHPPPR